ncbi:MAG: nucleotidyltransferase protein [Bacteroidetes bacterium]|nr:nucleotidyltransferase protein [Bacteroidota bacterium]
MLSNTETSRINNPELAGHLETFIKNVTEKCPGNIRSIVLYGGVAKGDFTEGRSNTNLLLVFESIDLPVLDSLSVIFQKAISDFRFSPFLLTISEIEPAKNVFAVKLFDIQQHHILLYGEDPVKGLQFKKETLAFISEQELRNQISRMKYFYIRNFNMPEMLNEKILKSFTTLLINANIYLYLEEGKYYRTRDEIIARIQQLPNMEQDVLHELILLRKGELKTDAEGIKNLYGKLMLQYKHLIKDLQKMSQHG